MNVEDNKLDTELVAKYLAGEASPQEAMRLQDLLQDPGNKKAFEEYVQLWQLLPNAKVTEVPSVKQSWDEIQPKLSEKKPAHIRGILFNRYTAAACVIGIALVAALVWWKNAAIESTAGKKNSAFVTKIALDEIILDSMTDGSTVTLNRGSNLTYAKEFNQASREVTLNGEAFFSVAPNKNKPFVISIDDLKIQVVGTEFNVRRLADQNIEVQVHSGVVKMYTAKKELLVVKNQTGLYIKSTGELKLQYAIDSNSIGYVTHSFAFNDISFIQVCSYLSQAYHVNFKLDTNKFSECRITAQFKDESLEYILDVIDATLNTVSRKQGDTINIEGNGCK